MNNTQFDKNDFHSVLEVIDSSMASEMHFDNMFSDRTYYNVRDLKSELSFISYSPAAVENRTFIESIKEKSLDDEISMRLILLKDFLKSAYEQGIDAGRAEKSEEAQSVVADIVQQLSIKYLTVQKVLKPENDTEQLSELSSSQMG